MAFEVIHRPLFREHGSVYFANSKRPTEDFNYAFCEVLRTIIALLGIGF